MAGLHALIGTVIHVRNLNTACGQPIAADVRCQTVVMDKSLTAWLPYWYL